MDTAIAIVTSIDPTGLPPYQQISCKPISEAAAALDAARAEFDQRRKDLVELENTREQAEWRDAAASEKARAEHKPEPKRSHLSAHDRKLDDSRHQQRVCQLAVERAERALVDAIDRHGQEWGEEVDHACAELVGQWSEKLDEVMVLYAKLAAAFSVRAKVIAEDRQPRFAALAFRVEEVRGREWAAPQDPTSLPVIRVGDVLGALSEQVGTPAPEPPPPAVQPLPRQASPLRGRSDVEAELQEREAFMAQAARGADD
jgi:hypothetical protein